jgi:hypothetical protein
VFDKILRSFFSSADDSQWRARASSLSYAVMHNKAWTERCDLAHREETREALHFLAGSKRAFDKKVMRVCRTAVWQCRKR